MASKPKTSKWGSLLSGAVAGLESRLDTILAEEKDASAKSRAAEAAVIADQTSVNEKSALSDEKTTIQVSVPPARPNSRLQDRLSKATASRTRSNSLARPDRPLEAPVRVATPSQGTEESDRMSSDGLPSRPSVDSATKSLDSEKPQAVRTNSLVDSVLPINPAADTNTQHEPMDTVQTNSEELTRQDERPNEVINQTAGLEPDQLNKTTQELEIELARARADHAAAEELRREETTANLERIDALQAKLQYLAKETIAAVKQANASSSDSNTKKLAAKDERIALLMDEGEKLSKKELRNLTTIKRLNEKNKQDSRDLDDLRRRIATLEHSESMLMHKVQRLEQSEKQSTNHERQTSRLESEVASLKSDLDLSNTIAASLRQSLAQADDRVASMESQCSDAAVQSKTAATYQEKLQVAEEEARRSKLDFEAELKQLRETAAAEKAQAHNLELELRAEVASLESRMESLRFKAEEASSDTAGDAQAKLLRQIEILQTQYSLAAENWRTIEESMDGRVTAIELERDEAARREAETRKKSKEASTKMRQLENDLERASDELQAARKDLAERGAQGQSLTGQVRSLEETLDETKADFERQRQVWEAELAAARMEDEQRRRQSSTVRSRLSSQAATAAGTHSRRQSNLMDALTSPPSATSLQASTVPIRKSISRIMSTDSSGSLTPDRANHSHRPSVNSIPSNSYPWRVSGTDWTGSSSPIANGSRVASAVSLANLQSTAPGQIPPTPPTGDALETETAADADDFDSPRMGTTINDVVSASTVHAGPSVQLVERMSSSIRRLEAEKAAHRDEMARLQLQRDEARDQVVVLMRQNEEQRQKGQSESLDSNATTVEKDSNTDKEVQQPPIELRGSTHADSAEVRAKSASGSLTATKDELAVLRKRYDACLEMLGEREEECAELKSDVAEMKRIYRELAAQMGR